MPSAQRITSRQHPIVRRFRRVALRRAGDPLVLLDGEHLVDEALSAGVAIDALITDGRRSSVVSRARAAGASVYEAGTAVLEAVSPVKTPSGIVAIAAWHPGAIASALDDPHGLALGLVDVQDPGNLGSVIRAAAALGATGVLALDRSADPGGWRALRGAMGSTFRVPIARGRASDALAEARRRGLRVAAATIGSGEPIGQADLRQPLLLCLGGEGAGLPADIEEQADLRLTIAMERGVESLNVAVTAGIILVEARRQRTMGRA